MGAYSYVLLVQDIFSRQLFAKPSKSVSDARVALQQILAETGRTPMRLDTDGGAEFASSAFKALMTSKNIRHVIKDKEDLNAIATVDAGIAALKRAIKRRREQHGGTWLDQLDAAVKGYNKTPHSATDAPPNDMSDDVVFSEQKEAAEKMADNMKQIDRRRKRLEKDGGFRVYAGKKRGLKRRVDEATWSTEIYEVTGFKAPGIVVDQDGNEHLTKLVKPVPLDSSITNASSATSAASTTSSTSVTQSLRDYAVALSDMLGATGQASGAAMRALKTRKPIFSTALSATNMSFSRFVSKFPDVIRTQNGRLYPKNQQTLSQ